VKGEAAVGREEGGSGILDKFKLFSNIVRTQVSSIAGPLVGTEAVIDDYPKELLCSLTFINIPWQSIIGDLLENGL
jgi:hypothetical protein